MRLQWLSVYGCCPTNRNQSVHKSRPTQTIESPQGRTFTGCIFIHASGIDKDGNGGHRALQALQLRKVWALATTTPDRNCNAPLHLDIQDECHC